MSRLIKDEREFREAVDSGRDAFVLFYAEWCPFCIRFLPVFEALARNGHGSFLRIPLDGNERLFEELGVEIYPSVLLFSGGAVARRLNGVPGRGLGEQQLTRFVGP